MCALLISAYRFAGQERFFYGRVKTKTTRAAGERQAIMAKLRKIKHLVSMYSEFLPTVLKNHKYSCETFKAGQIAEHFALWRELTNDKTILSDVLRSDIDCTVTSVQQRLPAQKFSKQEFPIV